MRSFTLGFELYQGCYGKSTNIHAGLPLLIEFETADTRSMYDELKCIKQKRFISRSTWRYVVCVYALEKKA